MLNSQECVQVNGGIMKKSDVDNFEKVNSQLEALLQELTQLVKKSPDNPVNKFKLKFINEIIHKSNELLGDMYKPFSDFANFEEEDLSSNSDVTFIIAQYLTCMEKLRADNICLSRGYWVWTIEDSEESIRTVKPEKLNRR